MSPVRFKDSGGTGGGTATVVLGPDFGTAADLDEAAQFTLYSQAQSAQLAAAEAASHAEKQTMQLAQARTIEHSEKQTMAMLTRQGDITLLRYTTSQILAQKDSWCDVIAGCAVDLNRDGTDLSCDGIVASRKDLIIGWDLSGLPTGATVIAATVTLQTKTVAVTGAVLTLHKIVVADETWAESTVKCSNIPATDITGPGSPIATATPTNVAGADTTWVLDSTGRTRVRDRMGVGSFSVRATLGLAGTVIVFESSDEGTNNTAGPRLEITWTMPA